MRRCICAILWITVSAALILVASGCSGNPMSSEPVSSADIVTDGSGDPGQYSPGTHAILCGQAIDMGIVRSDDMQGEQLYKPSPAITQIEKGTQVDISAIPATEAEFSEGDISQ